MAAICLILNMLTHWSLATHILGNKQVMDCQAIVWNKYDAHLLPNGPLGPKFSEICIWKCCLENDGH